MKSWAAALAVVVASVLAALLVMTALATWARPEPEPCLDVHVVEIPPSPSPSCAMPEAPAWLVIGGGVATGIAVAGGGVSFIRRRDRLAAAGHAAVPR